MLSHSHQHSIQPGCTVAYSAAFLRSIGCFSGDMPQARGKVSDLRKMGETTLAEVEWDIEGMPKRVNVKNLVRVTDYGILEP